MVMNNVINVNLKSHIYYTLKEFSYFMLANQMQKSQLEQARESQRLSLMESTNAGSRTGSAL